METLELLRLKLAYNHWANLRALESLRTTEAVSRKASSALVDILMNEKLWLTHLTKQNTGKVPSHIFRGVSTVGYEALIEESYSGYHAYLEPLNEGQLDDFGTFNPMLGNTTCPSTREVLTHVFNQSASHRGQIALAVRDEGGEPVASDYLSFLRSLVGDGNW